MFRDVVSGKSFFRKFNASSPSSYASLLLVASFQQRHISRHGFSTCKAFRNTTDNPSPTSSSNASSRPLTSKQKEYLDGALRVNHAGELAATLIYAAQTPPIVRAHPQLRSLMKHMYDQEAGHFKTFKELLPRYRVRPTAMYPVWEVAATVLGWGTAMMGREAAMACTEAVETEIGTHYNNQVRVLLQWINEMEAKGEHVGADILALVADLKRIRDEELEHLDSAVEHDSKEAQPYELLTNIIRSGCRTAIWISQRV